MVIDGYMLSPRTMRLAKKKKKTKKKKEQTNANILST